MLLTNSFPACEREIMESAFSISALKDSLSAYGIPFEVSDNPSNYLCNHAYYHGLQYIEKTDCIQKWSLSMFPVVNALRIWMRSLRGCMIFAGTGCEIIYAMR